MDLESREFRTDPFPEQSKMRNTPLGNRFKIHGQRRLVHRGRVKFRQRGQRGQERHSLGVEIVWNPVQMLAP